MAAAWMAAALLLAFTTAANARTIEGRVTHVTDGDTIWVRPADGGATIEVRLQGIDAPEICQPFGTESREALAARVLHRRVELDVRAQDSYDRSLARVSFQGHDVGAWLVAGGYAWSSRYQRRSGAYAREEDVARQERRGLWAQAAPLEPRRFRQQHGSCRLAP